MTHGRWARWLTLVALGMMATAGCAGPSTGRQPGGDAAPGGSGASSGPKRVVAAVMGVHTTLQSKTIGPGRPPGYDSIEGLVSAGLVIPDGAGGLRGQLAEVAPSIENGLWRVSTEGGMEISWRIRDTARWHDGTAFTSADLAFTARVLQDREIPNFRDTAFDLVDRIDTSDPRTVVVSWKRPFVDADQLFSELRIVPLPRHLLEPTFVKNKSAFLELPYWRDDFIGTGPYRVREWALDRHIVVDANADYVLGRPRVDQVEVRFIPDPNTLLANVLAGEIDVTMGRGLSLEQAVEVRERWSGGRADIAFESWVAIYPQMIDPSPRVILEVPFRRALLQMIDRSEMVESIQHGLVPVAHTILNPVDPEYATVEPQIVKYTFDPRAGAAGIEALGYTRDGEGGFRDASGQRLGVEIRSTAGDINEKAMFTVASYWQRAGLVSEPVVISRARANDREWRYTRPGFELQRQPNALSDLDRYHSSQVPLPENNFTGTSKHRYMNPEMDALIDRYFSTIPRAERVAVVGQIVRHISSQIVPLPLFYDANPVLLSNRVQNVTARKGGNSTEVWNVETWDVIAPRG